MTVDRTAYYTYKDIALGLKVCVRTVARWWKNRPKMRWGNVVRITGFELLRFIQEMEAAGKLDKVRRTVRPSVRHCRKPI